MTLSIFTPRRALLSVSDKRGIVELATTLHEHCIELVATGNTSALLKSHGLPITDVADCTGFPEMLNGRVKTLHPAIHAGLLANGEQDETTLREHNIQAFDLLVINLYPFEEVIQHNDCSFEHAIENIDIGGPAMIRAAAKNHCNITVVVTPDDYLRLSQYIIEKQAPSNWNFTLARKAFAHTAHYDKAISNYLNHINEQEIFEQFPSQLTMQFNKKLDLRYGENPHQCAAFYINPKSPVNSLASTTILQGKQLSYNNLLDADAAFNCIKSLTDYEQACVIVKHGNPCGIAARQKQSDAYLRAYETDPISSYGGIIAFNQTLEAETAVAILTKQFVEVIIAPAISREAADILAKKENIRVLEIGPLHESEQSSIELRSVNGGILVQTSDNSAVDPEHFQTVTTNKPSEQQLRDLVFAWRTIKSVKSNAIVFAKNEATIGIGAGQTSRIMSTRIGLWQAESAVFSTQEAVMASDAFLPFADNIQLAAEHGITAVIQPGGSIRDEEVIHVANELGLVMLFTRTRHFKH